MVILQPHPSPWSKEPMGPRGPAYSGPVSPLLDHALVTWNSAILLGPNDLSSFPESTSLCLRALLPGWSVLPVCTPRHLRWLAICRRHQWLLDVGAKVSYVCTETPHSGRWSQAGERWGQGRDVHLRIEGQGAGTPSSVIFHCRTWRSLRILKLAFQVSMKLICQGKKVGHILFNSLLA